MDSEFFDRTYDSFADRLNATILSEAFGEEIGQNSWLTAGEHRGFSAWLETGCRVTGVDLHEVVERLARNGGFRGSLTSRARPDAAAMSFSPRSGRRGKQPVVTEETR